MSSSIIGQQFFYRISKSKFYTNPTNTNSLDIGSPDLFGNFWGQKLILFGDFWGQKSQKKPGEPLCNAVLYHLLCLTVSFWSQKLIIFEYSGYSYISCFSLFFFNL